MSNLVLYRKYRPLDFKSVVSQDHIKTTLSNAVANSRIGHAYLFIGPRGVGKTTLARIFARAINCTNRKDANPCNECENCKGFMNANSLDLLEIDAASHTGVDNIRELIEHLQFAPTKAPYKVIIVDEVHMLSKGAFNALLKTLEEPPKHAVFILATTEVHKVPATIVSRTQRFDFKKVSIADLAKHLKYVAGDVNVKVSEGALLEIAAAADGSFRDGLSLLDQIISFSDGEVTEDLVEQVLGFTGVKTLARFLDLIIENNTLKAVNFISNLMYEGRDLNQFEKDFMEYLRKILLAKVGVSAEFGFSSDVAEKIMQQAQALTMQRLVKIIQIFQKVQTEIKWSSVQSLPLELAAVEATEETPVAHSPENPAVSRPEEDPGLAKNTNFKVSATSGDELAKIISVWPQILEKIKEYNHSLISSFKLAKPLAVEGKELVVAFPYKFHKEAIEARKNRIIVDQVIEDVTGSKIMIKPIMQKDAKGTAGEADNDDAKKDDAATVESALKILGGEVE